MTLLNRATPAEYIANWTSHRAESEEAGKANACSAIVFRLRSEWFALPTKLIDEIAESRPIHPVPHQRNASILGLVNVRGELVICVSLARMMGAIDFDGPAPPSDRGRWRPHERLIVIAHDTGRIAFPVDQVQRTQRFDPSRSQRRAGRDRPGFIQLHDRPARVGRPSRRLPRRRADRANGQPGGRMNRDLSQLSMHDLFRLEAESQTQVLTTSLLALEREPAAARELEACMRAAHSLKGAARIVDINAGVDLAHAMETFLVAAQDGQIALEHAHTDLLLQGVDLMIGIARSPDLTPGGSPRGERRADIDRYIASLEGALKEASSRHDRIGLLPPDEAAEPIPTIFVASAPAPDRARPTAPPPRPQMQPLPPFPAASEPASAAAHEAPDRVLRVTVTNLNRLLGLAGESLVGSRRLKPFGQSLLRLKRLQHDAAKAVGRIHDALPPTALDEPAQMALADARRLINDCSNLLSDRLAELEESDRDGTNLAHRLYDQALACRMRPFSDGVVAFPRMVRDLGRSLGKQVRLEIIGGDTEVDRDILDQLDAPLVHLLRNAVDHAIETVAARLAAGKPAEGVVRLEARHSAGALQIIVSDDGRGIDLNAVRAKVVERRLATPETAARLSEPELLEFLFLPGFSLKDQVTEVSGRGVGLDVVHDMLKRVRGVARTSSEPGRGSRFQLQLPLTLSVVRTLVVEIGGHPYAFPLAYINRAIALPRQKIEVLEGRQHFNLDGEHIVFFVLAHQIIGGDAGPVGGDLSVLVIGDPQTAYGLVVDRFIGGRELVVHPLDPRLGKIKDISAGALMEDGSPVLIVDVEDMIRSMEQLAGADRLSRVDAAVSAGRKQRKRVLVVDDSLTVRELERKLLDRQGYEVVVAVDGMDGWNALRSSRFDLVITDVDMPRMDGIELVKVIKADAEAEEPCSVMKWYILQGPRRRPPPRARRRRRLLSDQRQLPERYPDPGSHRPDRRGRMRIGIVNASPAATEALRGVLRRAAGHRVVWTAATGHEAVAACARDLPDIVLMELIAPRIDGVAATREIMARTPCPILIVAGNVKISAGRVFEAMGCRRVRRDRCSDDRRRRGYRCHASVGQARRHRRSRPPPS